MKWRRRACSIESVERRFLLATIYVDANATGGIHDGTSWPSAYTDLQQALSQSVSGDQIHVADGTYQPGSLRSSTFQLKLGVSLLGGYAGDGASNPNERNVLTFASILSGEIGAVGSNADNAFHVVTAIAVDQTAVIDGFTITAGNADANSGSPNSFGGGMFISNASPTVNNCVFDANAGRSGGGMYNEQFSSPELYNCKFTTNSAIANGGGIFNDSSSPSLVNCWLTSNVAGADGGGMYNSMAWPILRSCSFVRNQAQVNGGGVRDGGFGGYSVYINCIFNGNSALSSGSYGGAIDSATSVSLTGCIFTGNSSIGSYGGLFLGGSTADTTVTNCTFVGNWQYWGGSAVIADWSSVASWNNCVIWGNSSRYAGTLGQFDTNGGFGVAFCDIQGGYYGPGNKNADPQFYRDPKPGVDGLWGTPDDDYGDLRLRITSPCIDAGNDGVVPPGTSSDLAGNPRSVDVPGVRDPGALVDMGAYERVAPFADGSFAVDGLRPAVKILFSGYIDSASLAPADLVLTNVTTSQAIDCGRYATCAYDSAAKTATWSFSILLPDGNYRAILATGSVLDTLGSPAISVDLSFDFFSLGGDANRDRKVDVNDLYLVASNWQGAGKVFSQGDFNYDGKIDAKDLGILSAHWQQTLVPPPLAQATSMMNAPKRAPTRVISLI